MELHKLVYRVSSLPISNVQKIHAYSIALLWLFSWPLCLYDFSCTFMLKLDRIAGNYLRNWSGLAKCGSNHIFFLSCKDLGFNIPSFQTLHKQQRATFWEHIKHSTDPDIKARLKIVESWDIKKWNPFLISCPSYRAEKKQANENSCLSISSVVAAKRTMHAQQQNDKHKNFWKRKCGGPSSVNQSVKTLELGHFSAFPIW